MQHRFLLYWRFREHSRNVTRIESMQQAGTKERLSLIPTLWSLVFQAHQTLIEAAMSARRQLLERYREAAYRYLRKLLRNAHAADDVFQEFALRLMHGQLRGANPEQGRFRNFVKGTLFHLVADYRRQQVAWPGPLPSDGDSLVAPSEEAEADRVFVESWRDELLARAWSALAEVERLTGTPYHAVLRFRADHPELTSLQTAELLTSQFNQPFTAAGVRQVLHRAREKFADFLLDDVTHSIRHPTREQVEDELVELGLLGYCHPALERCQLRA
jgi:RNA polymerase sigma-70 factor (ECF subfamily)